MSCCRKTNESNRIKEVLIKLEGLSPLQMRAIEYRYILVLEELSRRCILYSWLFHVGHFIITVGSLIVPALISVQYSDSTIAVNTDAANIRVWVYWLTWIISFLVTASNGVIVLYKVDKKFYYLHTIQERMRSEGWQYFQLTGRYAGGLIKYAIPVTHANQHKFFCNYVEKIRMRQIEEEYYKYDEAHNGSTVAAQTAAASNAPNNGDKQNSLYPPSLSEDIQKYYRSSVKPDGLQQIVRNMIQDTSPTQTSPLVSPLITGDKQSDKQSAASTPKEANEIINPPLSLIASPSIENITVQVESAAEE